MLLCEVFPPELIKIELDAEDKDEALEELVDYLCQVKNIDCREKIMEALMDRESKMSTGIKKGIAIPHGRTDAIGDIQGILGISKTGINYDALDGQPVYLIFVILSPPTDTEKLLHLLKCLAVLLDNPQFCRDILAQNDPQGASQIIKKYEDIYITSD